LCPQSVHKESLPAALAHPWTWWTLAAPAESHGTKRRRCRRRSTLWAEE
jgi:hypothetical protein